jgi:hypothetical protein
MHSSFPTLLLIIGSKLFVSVLLATCCCIWLCGFSSTSIHEQFKSGLKKDLHAQLPWCPKILSEKLSLLFPPVQAQYPEVNNFNCFGFSSSGSFLPSSVS